MQASEQGVHGGARHRYSVIPRTLIFLTSIHPRTNAREVLLLKGAPTKRLWANKYNGIGGHVEAGEDIYAAAVRELAEETGLTGVDLTLRGVINILVQPDAAPAGVVVFLFAGAVQERHTSPSAEGELDWLPVAELQTLPLVDDLYELLPLVLSGGGPIYGHYAPRADGTMAYRFVQA